MTLRSNFRSVVLSTTSTSDFVGQWDLSFADIDFKYLYDFGDGWTHSIKIERTFSAIGTESPTLLKSTEDVGGEGY
ncbi:IS1096 element passenger TnpR family protein [Rhizobium leguminosarum]|uniref:IS1096 element passenger TnpR family protein n=1 Tax=Rhizobium leguminosarum TaxID=384 RepID=UPI0028F3F7A0|nr:hypothetical protein [Rhizobium leguminosarum]